MIKIAIGFLLGCLGILNLPSLPGIGWSALCFLTLIIALLLKRWALASLLIGILWAGFEANQVIADRLPLATTNQDILITGHIIGIPAQHPNRLVFQFSPDQNIANSHSTSLPHYLKISWYYPPAIAPKAGEIWQLKLRMKPVHSLVNPGGFDYERWLFIHDIGASGYVRKSVDNRRISQASLFSLAGWRQKLLSHIQKLLPMSHNTALIEGLTVGYRANITSTQWQILRETGTSHLMAISGLHIGLAAAIGLFLFRWLWSRNYRLLHLLPAHQAGAIGGIILALCYACLAGFSIPTQRAFMMVCMFMLAWIQRRNHYRSQIVALSLLLVLIHDPFAVLSPGLWLSYAAVTILLLGQDKYKQRTRWHWTHAHLLLAFGLSPLLLLFFGQISLIAPLANVIAIPLVSFITVPLLLLAVSLLPISSTLATSILQLADYSLSCLWHILTMLANWSMSSVNVPGLPLSLILLLIFATGLLLLPKGIPGRWLGLVAVIPCLLFKPARPAASMFWFDLLDVGQGLAAVIQTQHHCLVFDTGPAFSGSFNAGKTVLIPFLQHRNIHHIDTLIVSHGDNDHIGGASALLNTIPTTDILSSVPSRLPKAQHCYTGQHWRWDGVEFEILAPQVADQGSDNNLSCVLRIDNTQSSVLLTGDIERKAEQRLIQHYHHKLRSDVLVVPHHGSKTSSSVLFIDNVNPSYALFPVGFHNRYHFPARRILNRYQRRGIKTLQTASEGAIEFKFTANQPLSPVTSRHKNLHIWRWKATE